MAVKNLIRIASADVDGNKKVILSLTAIKGVGYQFSNALCHVLKLDKNIKTSELSDEQIAKIEEAVQNPMKLSLPRWLINRRNDPGTGEDKHLTAIDVKLVVEDDIKTMKKIKSYKGQRHQWGLTVRGQRTKSNFRKSKGKASRAKKRN